MKTTNKGIKEFIFEQKCIPWRVKNLFSREKILLSFCNEIIRDFSEFSGISIAKIYKYIKNFHQFTNKEWDSIPRNEYEKKATEFYTQIQVLSATPFL